MATGAITLRRYASVADTGKTINPHTAEGQDEGTATRVQGHALFEAMAYQEGQLHNGSPSKYRIPLATDIPEEFETILFEGGGGSGPYGATTAPDEGGDNLVRGLVTRLAFVRDFVDCTLVASGEALRTRLRAPTPCRAGDQLLDRVEPERSLAIPAQPAVTCDQLFARLKPSTSAASWPGC